MPTPPPCPRSKASVPRGQTRGANPAAARQPQRTHHRPRTPQASHARRPDPILSLDDPDGVVEATLGGLMSIEEVAAYTGELRSTLAAYRLDSFAMVIDVSDFPVQQQEMIRAMGEHMATMPKARALAIVTGSSLARMQIKRLFTQPYARIVSTIEEGRAWVVSGTEPSGN